MGILTYDNTQFLMDGKPFQILSGAIHYFRVPEAYWEDRLKKLRACGFNTVETYVCWNRHERKPGQFDFSGQLDLERFIATAQSLGLYVIVRPGPYICAEWEFGGLPAWLLKEQGLALRCNDERYLEKVRPYYEEVFRRVRPFLCTNGGPVIMVQVENEYGSYGDDGAYLQNILQLYRDNHMDCLLFTADGSRMSMLSGGSIPGVFVAINTGTNIKLRDQILKQYRPGQPFFCAEFWSGWFEHWHDERRPEKAQEVADMVQDFFDVGGSFNMYMFHGGTNFGFWNGANHTGEEYLPTITSYDYRAPLNEAGDMTETYYAIRDVICRNTGMEAPQLQVCNTPKAAYGKLALTQQAPLFENLSRLAQPVQCAAPQTMEQLDQDVGYLLYSTRLHGPLEPVPLILSKVHDRANCFLDGKPVGIWERSGRPPEVTVELAAGESVKLDILVENMGRVNYGPKLMDRKGLPEGVRLERRFHLGWEHFCLPMEELSGLQWQESQPAQVPAFYRGVLTLEEEPCDSFLRLDGFKKGFVMVNGINIGRYFNEAGPQKTLYVPAPFLQKGDNEILLFESDGCEEPVVTFLDAPELG